MDIQVKVIRRPIKHPRIEIKNFETRLILPYTFNTKVTNIIDKYKKVIFEKYKYFEEVKNLSKSLTLSKNANFKEDIQKYIEEFTKYLEVKPTKVMFRKMKKRWGSCSKDGKLIFNTKLMYLPADLVKYVVCHEVCHLVERRHNENFYMLVKNFYGESYTYYVKILDSYYLLLHMNKIS